MSATARGSALRGFRALLGVPLFLKLVLANAAVVAVAMLAGALVVGPTGADTAVIAVLVVLTSMIVNAVIVTVALMPLNGLQETAARVVAGDLDARVPASPIADRAMQQLCETFNTVLDAAASSRLHTRNVARRSEAVAEEERKRIASELHDGTAQDLAALRLRLRLARLSGDAEDQNRQLDGISEDLAGMIDSIRTIALGLRPPALDMLGLGAAVRALAKSIAATGLDVAVDADPDRLRLRPETELVLYRILQEALGNVLRHAHADRVRVCLGRTDGRVELSVEDNGRGFLATDAVRYHSLGLLGMQERAAYVGGSIDIVSAPGRGTRVTAVIPESEAA